VWSFYDVGPAEDVRLEFAVNLDQYRPTDIGRCGEPYTPLVACNKTLGLWAHGLAGFGVAGEEQPQNPFQDIKDTEFGGRLEFRLGRFSFQLSDFWGYEDLPYTDVINVFSRNVDPLTGRPLRAFTNGSCVDGTQTACLPIHQLIDDAGNGSTLVDTANRRAVTASMPNNMQLFTMICATSIGFNALDPTACGQSVFNSQRSPISGVLIPRSNAKTQATIASTLSNFLAGNPVAVLSAAQLAGGVQPPAIALNVDPCDSQLSDGNGGCGAPGRTGNTFFAGVGPTLNQVLTDEQEALLGCGPFYGTDCEADGIDLLNAEASVLMQAFVGFEGAYTPAYVARNFADWALNNGNPQPGTVGFVANGSGTPAGRFYGGQLVQVAGARSPYDDLNHNGVPDYLDDRNHNGIQDFMDPDPNVRLSVYNPNVDGCPAPAAGPCAGAHALVIPAQYGASAGQQFQSEMAAVSFNLQELLVVFSSRPSGTSVSELDEFDPKNPYATFDPSNPATYAFRGKCSLTQPQYCSSVKSLFDVAGVQRNTVRAGGNGTYGRRDFAWDSGGEAVLKYEKRNVLGFAGDFAEDFTKSNWGFEFTWIKGQKFSDNDKYKGITTSDTLNLTVSVDRPTFINFLNPNRTFFFNTQVFFQYITNYSNSFPSTGPFNVLGTFTIQTGYFQDRLLPGVTFVYDVKSDSGGALPEITYRFTENFSAQVGMNFFWGRWQVADMPLQGLGAVGNEVGKNAYKVPVENGLAVVRNNDEVFLRIRYTF
jgi:hypothetical protein